MQVCVFKLPIFVVWTSVHTENIDHWMSSMSMQMEATDNMASAPTSADNSQCGLLPFASVVISIICHAFHLVV